MIPRMLGAILVLGSVAGLGAARPVGNWPYEQLMEEADLVVIAVATATADSGEVTHENLFKAKYIGVNTTFAVRGILKGKHKGDQLTVLHYRLEPGTAMVNGPLHVRFHTEGFSIELKGPEAAKILLARPEYMLFLK